MTRWFKNLKNGRMPGWLPLAAVCAAALAVLGLFCLHISRENRAAYTAAEELLARGEYAQAEELLAPLARKDYRGAYALRAFCRARLAYGSGGSDPESIGEILRGLPSSTNALSAGQRDEIEAFRQQLKEEQKRLEQEAARQQKEAEQRRQLEQIRSGLPYEGLSEEWIGETILGSPSPGVREQSIWYNGGSYSANLYDFTDANGTLLYTVGCVQGRVVKIWDKRPAGYAPAPAPKPTGEPGSDPYRASEFSNPDDFYDEYPDDFNDYYDAEYYWETHH